MLFFLTFYVSSILKKNISIHKNIKQNNLTLLIIMFLE